MGERRVVGREIRALQQLAEPPFGLAQRLAPPARPRPWRWSRAAGRDRSRARGPQASAPCAQSAARAARNARRESGAGSPGVSACARSKPAFALPMSPASSAVQPRLNCAGAKSGAAAAAASNASIASAARSRRARQRPSAFKVGTSSGASTRARWRLASASGSRPCCSRRKALRLSSSACSTPSASACSARSTARSMSGARTAAATSRRIAVVSVKLRQRQQKKWRRLAGSRRQKTRPPKRPLEVGGQADEEHTAQRVVDAREGVAVADRRRRQTDVRRVEDRRVLVEHVVDAGAHA